MKKTMFVVTVLMLFAFVTLSSCGTEVSNVNSEVKLVVDQSFLRKDYRNIPVCFINGTRSQQQGIQKVIESQYNARTNVHFDFRSSCPNEAVDAVRVRFRANRNDGCSMLGAGRPWPVAHNPCGQGSATGKENMYLGTGPATDNGRSLALHEFGHALGFMHEQLHKDAPQGLSNPEGCSQTGKGRYSNVTSYDKNSVMISFVCYKDFTKDPKILTTSDIKGINQSYPANAEEYFYAACVLNKTDRPFDLHTKWSNRDWKNKIIGPGKSQLFWYRKNDRFGLQVTFKNEGGFVPFTPIEFQLTKKLNCNAAQEYQVRKSDGRFQLIKIDYIFNE